MIRWMCKSKLHGLTVTDNNLHYVGSITIDQDLLDAADILPFEWLLIVNVNTGARFETYAIPGARGSGVVGLNGAAARLGLPGDKVIVLSYASLGPEELKDFSPRLVFLGPNNQILDMARTETAEQTWHTGEGYELAAGE
jgi:aspartate 1-decarboxylase